MDWTNYRSTAFDELIGADGGPRPAAGHLVAYLSKLSDRDVAARQVAASAIARVSGITFTVYSDGRNIDRAWPFDLIPRVHRERASGSASEAGLKQRLRALNLFIGDVYGEQRIFKDSVVPAELLANSVNFRRECVGVDAAARHMGARLRLDLVRDARRHALRARGQPARPVAACPTCSRTAIVAKRVFRRAVRDLRDPARRRVPDAALRDAALRSSPRPGEQPVIARAHAGRLQLARTSSTRSSRSRWASSWSRAPTSSSATTTACTCAPIDGLERVDVIYRRVDDLFLDPEVFQPGLGARRARPHARVARRQRGASRTRPAPASPTTRSCTPTCPR